MFLKIKIDMTFLITIFRQYLQWSCAPLLLPVLPQKGTSSGDSTQNLFILSEESIIGICVYPDVESYLKCTREIPI